MHGKQIPTETDTQEQISTHTYTDKYIHAVIHAYTDARTYAQPDKPQAPVCVFRRGRDHGNSPHDSPPLKKPALDE